MGIPTRAIDIEMYTQHVHTCTRMCAYAHHIHHMHNIINKLISYRSLAHHMALHVPNIGEKGNEHHSL